MMWVVASACCATGSAQAGWQIARNGEPGFNAPPSYANGRLIDFSSVTPTSESGSGKITLLNTGLVPTLTGLVSGLVGMTGSVLSLPSPSNTTRSTYTVNFPNGGTSYVGFAWNIGLIDQNGAAVTYQFSDGTSKTLYSCKDTTNPTCLGAYASSNFLVDMINFFSLCILGCNKYDTIYLSYVPDNGLKITSVTVSNGRCDTCGFLGSAQAQNMYLDNVYYVDATVPPHHLEVTTPSAMYNAGGSIPFSVKACANAACTSEFTTGMTGTLTLSGLGLVAGKPLGQLYTIGARSSTTTVTDSISPSGTATVTLTAPSFVPTGSPAVYCGMGVPAAAGNSCNLTITQALHHIEVTTTSASSAPGAAVVYTVTACADVACLTKYTGGLSGTLAISGLAVTPSASQSFNISLGSYSTTVSFTPTVEGTMTVGASGLSVTPTAAPQVYCGMGVPATSLTSCSRTSVYTLDHIAVTTDSGAKVACAPYTYHLKACANADCSVTYTKGGVSGVLAVSGTGLTVLYPPLTTSTASTTFSIGTSGTADVSVWARSASAIPRTATVALSSVLPLTTGAASTYCGMGLGSDTPTTPGGSCDESIVNSALSLSVPDHVAGTSPALSLSAVKSNADASACTSLFSVPTVVPVTLSCGYSNPSTGTKSLTVAGVSLNCGGPGALVSLSFNASGLASTTLNYTDVGTLSLSASLTGTAAPILGVVLSTLTPSTFTAVPASLGVTLASTSQVAGRAFSASVVGKITGGAVAPNFGKEGSSAADYLRLTWNKTSGTNPGTFSGKGSENTSNALLGTAWSASSYAGASSVTDLMWTEVGTATLTPRYVGSTYNGVALAPLLGGALTGTASSISFTPDHFGLTVTQGCGSLFTYSGQPFTAKITAFNALGSAASNITTNYAGGLASAWTLAVSAGGSVLEGNFSQAVAASLFANGVATVNPTLSFANKLTVPTAAILSATSGALTAVATGSTVNLRSGRLKVSNAFASSIDSRLDIPVQAQYWNDRKVWVQNNGDSCTTVPRTAIGLTNFRDHKGSALTDGFLPNTAANVSGITISGGRGTLSLTPSPTATGISNFRAGSVDLSINLGSGAGTDSSCLASPPSSTGAQLPWLRSQNGGNGACAGVTGASSFLRDPSARVTFGVFQPESQRAVFSREMY
jgi:MSHA biogenesis protein MshQ